MIQQNLDLGITGTDLDALSPVDRVIKVFLKVGHSRPLLIYFRLFNTVDNKLVNKEMLNIKFADDWSQIADLWYQKRPLYQLSHNHFPCLKALNTAVKYDAALRG